MLSPIDGEAGTSTGAVRREHPTGPQHLSLDELALLVEGRVPVSDRARLERHVATCGSCFDAYREGVEIDAGRRMDPPARLDDVHRADAFAVVGSAEDARRRRFPKWKTPRMAFASTVAIAACAAAIVLTVSTRSRPSGPTKVSPPLIAYVTEASIGSIALPGVELAADQGFPVYRSSANPTRAARAAIDQLYAKHESGLAGYDETVWLVSGLIADGQLDMARSIAASSLAESGDDRFAVALASIAFRSSHVEEAHDILSGVVAREPSSALARFGLAHVLFDRGAVGDARRHLGLIIEHTPDSPIADRARRLLASTDTPN